MKALATPITAGVWLDYWKEILHDAQKDLSFILSALAVFATTPAPVDGVVANCSDDTEFSNLLVAAVRLRSTAARHPSFLAALRRLCPTPRSMAAG